MHQNDYLRREINRRRRILEEEFGMQGYSSAFPPDLELLYLDYLLEFEIQYASGRISGVQTPEGLPVELIQDSALSEKWLRLRKEMQRRGMDSVYRVISR